MRPRGALALYAGMLLLVPGTALAETVYQIQPIIALGQPLGDSGLKPSSHFKIGTLNDSGQISFTTVTNTGGEALVQSGNDQFTVIVRPGGDAPGGTWPSRCVTGTPVSMNQQGDIGFAATVAIGDRVGTGLGAFRWDYQPKRTTAVAVKGMPAVGNGTFEWLGDAPVLNSHGEMALVAGVRTADGKVLNSVLFRGRDGELLPIAATGQEMPGGHDVQIPFHVSLNDDSKLGFLARQKDGRNSAYLWEKGTITPVLLSNTEVPGVGKIVNLVRVMLNNQNSNMLVGVSLRDLFDPMGLLLLRNGKFTPVALPGQEMPGGGTFLTIQWAGIGYANNLGQHAFLAIVRDQGIIRTAAYLMDVDGKVSLILKSGTQTDLGEIRTVGFGAGNSTGVGLNNKGQVAVTIRVGSGPDTLALLTPVSPAQ